MGVASGTKRGQRAREQMMLTAACHGQHPLREFAVLSRSGSPPKRAPAKVPPSRAALPQRMLSIQRGAAQESTRSAETQSVPPAQTSKTSKERERGRRRRFPDRRRGGEAAHTAPSKLPPQLPTHPPTNYPPLALALALPPAHSRSAELQQQGVGWGCLSSTQHAAPMGLAQRRAGGLTGRIHHPTAAADGIYTK